VSASPEIRQLRLPAPLVLESGVELAQVNIAYRTWGYLNTAGDNAVLVCHALTGSADVDSWWPALLGPGRALDPERDFVVCSNVLGSCYGTTGPTSPAPGGGVAWGPAFPAVTVRDMVRLQRALLAALGVRGLRLVIGGSLGGMQALEWVASFPALVEAAVVIAAPGRHSAWATALSAAQRAAIEADPRFRGGHYPAEDPPRDGLATARMIAMCSYRSPESFRGRFGREVGPDGRFAVEGYLRHHGDRLVARFDANTYLTLVGAMDSHDVARGRGEYAEVLRRVRVPTLVVAISSDVLYPPEEVGELARRLPHATLELLSSPHGHDAFLTEGEVVATLVARFRAGLSVAPRRHPDGAAGVRVLKFGGTSVADAPRLGQVARIAAAAARCDRVAVVVSALAGVTDALVRAVEDAAGGRPWRDALALLAERHRACADQLAAGDAAADALAAVVADAASTLEEIARGGVAMPEWRDRVLACGERLCLPLAAAALARAGIAPVPWDTRELIVTDSRFGEAAVDVDASDERIAAAWRSLPANTVPVATGFIAADRSGRTTTIGRGGSDYSASLLAAALGADAVEIWTDVDGVLSAPPSAGVGGHSLAQLSYAEAVQLARHGGKVLHPATMAPTQRRGIPILVRNTFNPGGAFTVVAGTPGADGVVSVSALPDEGTVAVIGTGIAPLTLAIQRELSQAGIAVLASVATGSPHALTVKVPPVDAMRAVAVLHRAFVAPPATRTARRSAAGR
jgi:homoserine O-acetyltransferase/O-succinyltransferase